MHSCDQCGAAFTRKTSLNRHKESRCKSPPDKVTISHRYSDSKISEPHHDVNSRERSEKLQKLFRKLETAGSTPLDFHPVDQPDDNATEEEDDESSMEDEDNRTDFDDKNSVNSVDEVSSGEDEEDDEMDAKIWRIVGCKSCHEGCDELSSFKFFVRLRQNIDHDETFQKVLKTARAIRESECLTFKEALDKAIEKRKSLIFRAFAKAREESSSGDENSSNDEDTNRWCTDRVHVWHLILQEVEDENRDLLENFETYILYYRSLKRDKVYQVVMKTLELARGVGMSFNEALDFAVKNSKLLITRTVAKAKGEAKRLGKEWSFTYSQPGLLYT